MTEVRRRVEFRGHVQGVGFRGTLSKYCLRRHVVGWMCNAPDHELVVAELQGDERSVVAALRSVSAYFSDSSRCRGMSVKVVGELLCVDGESEMREVPWEEAALLAIEYKGDV